MGKLVKDNVFLEEVMKSQALNYLWYQDRLQSKKHKQEKEKLKKFLQEHHPESLEYHLNAENTTITCTHENEIVAVFQPCSPNLCISEASFAIAIAFLYLAKEFINKELLFFRREYANVYSPDESLNPKKKIFFTEETDSFLHRICDDEELCSRLGKDHIKERWDLYLRFKPDFSTKSV